MAEPIWKILLKLDQIQSDTDLNCSECFAILDQLAEAAIGGADRKSLLLAVNKHLQLCPGCREHYTSRLKELEASLLK